MSKVPTRLYVQPTIIVDESGDVIPLDALGEVGPGTAAAAQRVTFASDAPAIDTTTLAAANRSCVSYENTSVTSTQYILLIDLDNTGSDWPHDGTATAIDLDHLSVSAVFANGSAEAVVRLGVVTRIDETDADIMWIVNRRLGTQSSNNTITISDNYQPSSVHFEQSGGRAVGALSSVTDSNLAAVSTFTSLDSPAGLVEPGLGDVIMMLEYVAHTYAADVSVLYHAT
jgi:hypothetical protein